jgi:cobalt-zinc-cadmium efflux system membrane fusion protein
MNKRFARPAAMVFALPVLATFLGCADEVSTRASGERSDDPARGVTLASDVGATIGLAVEEVQPRTFTLAVTAPGKVRANQDRIAFVGPIIEGRISDVFVSWGDRVERGQVLAYLESVDVGEAKAAYFRSRAELRVAEANLERKRRLFDEQIIPRKDLLEAEAEYTSAQAEADAAEKALHVIGFTEEEVAGFSERHDLTAIMPIVAPISGTIVARQAVIGALADPSVQLFTIMNLSTLWVDAEVYEKDLDKVQPGQRVEISVIAYPDEGFSGRVTYIGDTVDDERRTAVVRTVVENPGGKLKPGMFATVRIITAEKRDAIILPDGAVLRENGKSLVVTEEGGRYRLREVQLGSGGDGMTEIVAGLNLGERVVTSGHYQIAAELLGSVGSE